MSFNCVRDTFMSHYCLSFTVLDTLASSESDSNCTHTYTHTCTQTGVDAGMVLAVFHP